MDFLILPIKIATQMHPLLGILLIVLYLSFLTALILAPINFIFEALAKFIGKK